MKKAGEILNDLRMSLNYPSTKMANYLDVTPAFYRSLEKDSSPIPPRLIASILRLATHKDADKQLSPDDFCLENENFDLKGLLVSLEQNRKRNDSMKYKSMGGGK